MFRNLNQFGKFYRSYVPNILAFAEHIDLFRTYKCSEYSCSEHPSPPADTHESAINRVGGGHYQLVMIYGPLIMEYVTNCMLHTV